MPKMPGKERELPLPEGSEPPGESKATASDVPKKDTKGNTKSGPQPEPVTKAAAQRGWYILFTLLAKIRASEVQLEAREFEDMASETAELSKQIPYVGPLFRMIGPLLIVGELLAKFQKVEEGAKARKEREQAAQANQSLYGQPESPV